MKHITFGDKSLLVGDEVADTLLDYAALLTREASGDTVQVAAISSDGDAVTASFLLGSGVSMMAETTHSDLPEPENAEIVKYMKEAMMRALVRPTVMPADIDDLPGFDDYQPSSDPAE
ncbi:MAG: hypothetical protein JWQ19_2623 [Subtercola sp.]|nr:hypothetical protein [Subtercola sp.]